MEYAWDPQKARTNRIKHGVDFSDAVRAMEDPARIEFVDNDIDYGEERVKTIGRAIDDVLVVISTAIHHNLTRVISARKATRHEEALYFSGL